MPVKLELFEMGTLFKSDTGIEAEDTHSALRKSSHKPP